MKKRTILCMWIVFIGMYWCLAETADARRMGGGKSFGSRPQYNRAAPSQSSPQRSVDQPSQGQKSTVDQSGRRPGLFGGFGGMLGGMLMGGMIGSLLFGGGHGGGIGILDILIIGGGLFLLFRFLSARRAATASAGVSGAGSGSAAAYEASQPRRVYSERQAAATPVPAGFDEEEFLKGARAAFVRLQSSWDKRDMEDIRQFTSAEVWEEINRQAQEDPEPSTTEIVSLQAEVTKTEEKEGRSVVSVLFNALLREDSNRDAAEDMREIWHFSREEGKPGSFWKLEGIQQVE
ncbi:Tim44 domain-containing protein [Desulfatiglans anilini]|uniref:Tim44 domain-containing protein n=1 Tax=Desulfatiglans anilini TaxID=90728 RepID=UPI00048A1443|nr:Tim44-like domain-containing protein [Desulfatiglans anilini]